MFEIDLTTEKMEQFLPENVSVSDGSVQNVTVIEFVDDGCLAWKICAGILMSLLIIVTLLGNGLVVKAVVSFERLRTIANMFIVSLAIADITVALLVMPVSLIAEVAPTLPIPWRFCYFWISCDVMCCTASILHLCIIALDRYRAIKYPFKYHSLMTKRKAIILISIVWVCSIGISFAPICLGAYSDQVPDYNRTFWEMHECGLNNISMTYALVSSSISFTGPLIAMIIAYVNIFVIAQRQVVEINRQYQVCRVTDSPRGENRDRMRRRSRQLTKDMKAVRTLGILMGVFIACWLPFFLMYVIMAICDHCSLPSFVVTGITWLGYVNSFANPCVYAFMNQDFREAFWRLTFWRNGAVPPPGAESPIKICFRRATAGCDRVEAVQL